MRTFALPLLAMAVAVAVVCGTPLAAAATAAEAQSGGCPPPSACYLDKGKPGSTPADAVVACAVPCNGGSIPAGCTRRCKPCYAEVCTTVCKCEIACPATGSCPTGN